MGTSLVMSFSKYSAHYFKDAYHSREHGKERLVVRFGGDEFLVLACGIDFTSFKEEFMKISSRLNREVQFLSSPKFTFDFSVGFAGSEELAYPWKWENLVAMADRRMYDSKKNKTGLY